ncbi:hypothetical protein PU629_00420 [Pullulanibacillus sp. KACC 23026]|uniref:hypothetical protein n=1 Tax=Pullulanibacillus sp. KACC 23026 TaxID=3028315 RepID=UPI0023B00AFC|nr:hypothetical protein [Pullulanibacillus sp. KACC 23026]WEG12853.1 hypothetical protein PU629_00420 [Pullulanibacillus sp. KACC 23026]
MKFKLKAFLLTGLIFGIAFSAVPAFANTTLKGFTKDLPIMQNWKKLQSDTNIDSSCAITTINDVSGDYKVNVDIWNSSKQLSVQTTLGDGSYYVFPISGKHANETFDLRGWTANFSVATPTVKGAFAADSSISYP